jgi:hypothetical protein
VSRARSFFRFVSVLILVPLLLLILIIIVIIIIIVMVIVIRIVVVVVVVIGMHVGLGLGLGHGAVQEEVQVVLFLVELMMMAVVTIPRVTSSREGIPIGLSRDVLANDGTQRPSKHSLSSHIWFLELVYQNEKYTNGAMNSGYEGEGRIHAFTYTRIHAYTQTRMHAKKKDEDEEEDDEAEDELKWAERAYTPDRLPSLCSRGVYDTHE